MNVVVVMVGLHRRLPQLLTDLANDLVTVQQVMSRTRSDPLFASWCRVASGLCLLLAKTLCNLGQPRQARDWWGTAQQAADRSGDDELSLWVSGERLVHGLYEQRPTPILLRKADEILGRASHHPCRGLAHVSTVRAQLLALEGRPEAGTALSGCYEVFEQLPASVTDDLHSVAGWAQDRLRYTEAWVHAHLGERGGLDQAVNRAHEILPPADSRSRAQVNLLHAYGHVRSGKVADGVRYAQHVYDAHPVGQRTVMVTRLAGRVLEAVPAERRSEPAVIGYREMLTDGQRRAIT